MLAWVVARLFLVLVLLLAFGQSSGVIVLGGDDCSDGDCPDGKQCPPECPTCTCAMASQPTVSAPHQTITIPALTELVLEFATPPVFAPSPDPREILHVPRSHVV